MGLMLGAAVLASVIAGGRERSHQRPRAGAATASSAAPRPSVLPDRVPTSRSQLVSDVDRAQQTIDDPASAPPELASAGRFEQLATLALEGETVRIRNAKVAGLGSTAAAAMRANLRAAAALGRLNATHRSLPPWKIVQAPAPNTLLGYFKLAQARSGVHWQYLAAIELIETRFGRVVGPSSAGAEGPMQFLPATWARYGSGDVHNPRDAVLGAARYLVASGAPRDMAGALYHYNPSSNYVHAVEDYAKRMHADGRAYYGYYYWQVVYAEVRRLVILPVGFPEARPVPVAKAPGA